MQQEFGGGERLAEERMEGFKEEVLAMPTMTGKGQGIKDISKRRKMCELSKRKPVGVKTGSNMLASSTPNQ